jgi:hypothetical protein
VAAADFLPFRVPGRVERKTDAAFLRAS